MPTNKNPKQSLKKISAYEIVEIFKNQPGKVFTYQMLTKKLQLKAKEETLLKLSLEKLLDTLVEQKVIDEIKPGVYTYHLNDADYLLGKVDMSANGTAYINVEGLEQDVLINAEHTLGALAGDMVKIVITRNRGDRQSEGKILEIVERAREEFVGTIKQYRNVWFFTPDNNKIPYDFFIEPNNKVQLENGIKGVIKITDWNNKGEAPIGKITKILGMPGEHETEIHAIMQEYGLTSEFPIEVVKEAEKISTEISADEIKKRRDFREVTTFTIDPVDAKDFDDALSVKWINENTYEIGVHIADVTHYVLPNTALEKEALRRATSVYLVDRTVPMLPEKLSNVLCSLRPNEDKLCYSAVFVLNNDAEILEQWFGRTIIHSIKRFTYEEAQEILENQKGELCSELMLLDDLAKKMRAVRFKRGAISFEKKEVKFKLDKKGKPISVFFKEAKDSNKLIEDFMLLANKKVAEMVGINPDHTKKRGKESLDSALPFVYRIHDSPNEEKLNQFAGFVKKLGYSIKTEGKIEIAKSLNQMLTEAHGKKEENMISQLAVRTMAKAVYSTNNIGHYGLSFDYYSHFTSPIRRYPDMMVHRLLNDYLNSGKKESKDIKSVEENMKKKKVFPDVKLLEMQCKHASDQEKVASEAERASIKYKQVEFMSDKTTQIFKAVVSGVTEYGIFAEIEENLCEGLIRLRDIATDFFELDAENYCVRGKRTKRVIRMGDEVFVKVKKADIAKKQLDFTLIL